MIIEIIIYTHLQNILSLDPSVISLEAQVALELQSHPRNGIDTRQTVPWPLPEGKILDAYWSSAEFA